MDAIQLTSRPDEARDLDRGPTRRISDFVASLWFEDLEADIVERVKLTVLDTVGVVLAARETGLGRRVVRASLLLNRGAEARVIGSGEPSSAAGAALANGTLSDILEAQDGWRFGGLHPCVVIPAALAMAERERRGGRDLIASIVAGYEVANRFAATVHPHHMAKGYMPNGTAGSIGCAAVAGRLLALSADGIAHALGIAGFLLPVSTAENLYCGYSIKPFHTGAAARTGIEAALLAREGFEACPVEGSPGRGRGCLEIMTGMDPDFGTVAEDLGERFTIRETYFKFFPACRLGQGAIEAAMEIAAAPGFDVGSVRRVTVRIYAHAARLLDRYLELGSPMGAAQFSLPYCVAAALKDGSYGLPQLAPDRLSDPALFELARKVSVVADEAMTRRYPETTPARVDVELAEGTVLSGTVEMPKGDPRRGTTTRDLFDKFHGLVDPLAGEAAAARILDAVMSLEDVGDLGRLTDVLCPLEDRARGRSGR